MADFLKQDNFHCSDARQGETPFFVAKPTSNAQMLDRVKLRSLWCLKVHMLNFCLTFMFGGRIPLSI